MRRKRKALLPLARNNERLPKVVREDQEKHKRISRLLNETPEILDQVHEDLKRLSDPPSEPCVRFSRTRSSGWWCCLRED
jgi:hypothetical protein